MIFFVELTLWRKKTAFNTMIACFVLNIVIVIALRQLMARWNKKRNQEAGIGLNDINPEANRDTTLDFDETDWGNKDIRYSL